METHYELNYISGIVFQNYPKLSKIVFNHILYQATTSNKSRNNGLTGLPMSTFAQRAFAWRQNHMWHLIGPKGQETISQRQQLSANLERWINLGVPKEEIQIKDKSKTTYQLIRCKYDVNNIYIYLFLEAYAYMCVHHRYKIF